MSSAQKSKRVRRPETATMTPAVLESLKKAHAAHVQMQRVLKLAREAEDARRSAVAEAWTRGATAKELAVTLEISLAKVYTLLPPERTA